MSDVPRRPISTYRLQCSQRFRLSDACDLLPYLSDLGITDAYSSPVLKATPGSTHGYDICDHSRLNPELGSEAEYAAWCAALQAGGFGPIVDVVPNHMSCDPTTNPWWRDVLENGPSSPYAGYFDIDWDPVKPELNGKVLLPLLGEQYGRVLERGDLRLRFEDGALHCGISIAICRSIRVKRREYWGWISTVWRSDSRATRRSASTSASSRRCRTCRFIPSRVPRESWSASVKRKSPASASFVS